ncbi:YdcH family protein [Sphingomonas lenta]|uniref:DUF465 domain-containing protein n=1 Tax=Sphingomonas lenta TaxID=1141887 RepID=A0A2A2SI61_9SPHN|nr:YdcH family protein [Sphingomonas lenta]PAX08850.1 hypothetical protein CKY28_05715 [Sphingomonas lenta]
MSAYVDRLVQAHRTLSRAIRQERARPGADSLELARLKKRRLAIKDRLSLIFPDVSEMRCAGRAALKRLSRPVGVGVRS